LTFAGKSINASNFSGHLKWSVRKLHQIAEARRSLYERWHGKSVDVVRLTVEQGREYGAIGKMVADQFSNPLVLAGDQAVMAAFWQALQEKPLAVVYLRGEKY
jgi:arginase family enzyme